VFRRFEAEKVDGPGHLPDGSFFHKRITLERPWPTTYFAHYWTFWKSCAPH
jgi:hypothetical protein